MKIKNFKINKYVLFCVGLLIAVGFYFFGNGSDHETVSNGQHYMEASLGAIVLTEEEKKDFNEGEQKMLIAVKKMLAGVDQKIKEGKLTEAEIKAFKDGVIETLKNDEIKELKAEIDALEEKSKKQGVSLAEMQLKIESGGQTYKSIGAVLHENYDALKKVYENGSGTKTFMVQMNQKGEMVMRPFDTTAKAGMHATVADVPSGNTAAVSQALDAATILRMGGGAQLMSQYRNTAWVFDLCNVVNAGWDMPFAIWYEEQLNPGWKPAVQKIHSR